MSTAAIWMSSKERKKVVDHVNATEALNPKVHYCSRFARSSLPSASFLGRNATWGLTREIPRFKFLAVVRMRARWWAAENEDVDYAFN